MKNYSVAIVGATGAVGRMMLKVLEEQNFPISELYLLASKRSKNKTIQYNDHDLVVQDINDFDFSNASLFTILITQHQPCALTILITLKTRIKRTIRNTCVQSTSAMH